MDDGWSQRWSRRGKLAAAMSNPARTPEPGIISFVYGDPDSPSLPLSEMVEAADHLAEHYRLDSLCYQDAIRGDGLNESLAEKLARDQGINAAPEQILIANGASAALSLVCDALLDPGDVVLTDAPAWMGATQMFQFAGAETIGIPLDNDGIDPALVEATLAELVGQGRRPTFLYTIPTFQNPTGVELSHERRIALARLADDHGLLILEDDAYNDLRFDGEQQPTIYSLAQSDNVLFLGTLSKTVAAGLRLGYAVGPGGVLAAMDRGRVDSVRNSFVAALADWYLRSGKLSHHIQKLRQTYRAKCEHMLMALEREMPLGMEWTQPKGGFFVWVTLPKGIDSDTLRSDCRAGGVDFYRGSAFYTNGDGRRNLRLSYSAVTLEEIDEGVARLASVIRSARRDMRSPVGQRQK
jgi:2-aminoadipate transaminase